MRTVSALIFDDIIGTTTGPWYTPSQFNAVIGAADNFAIQACTTMVSGTTNLTVQAEHSADSQYWFTVGTPADIVVNSVFNDAEYVGWRDGLVPPHMANVRFKITLSGTNPQCRLKLYVTGRVRGGAAATSQNGRK